MKFPESYPLLNQSHFQKGDVKLIPIRYEDREAIRQWRNDQIDFLRQKEPLSQADQDNYFQHQVSGLFEKNQPDQLLFSYLVKNELVGYGGLVHIDWKQKSAEISFLMKSEIQGDDFVNHWMQYLSLIDQLAFQELRLEKVFTYAYDLRPLLYEALKNSAFQEVERKVNELEVKGKKVDVLIHEKVGAMLSLRQVNQADMKLVFNWSNDPLVRKQSYHQDPIEWNDHKEWFSSVMADQDIRMWIGVLGGKEVGLVRIKGGEDENFIGVLVAPEHRGKGLASRLIEQGSKAWLAEKKSPVTAYIKEDNPASIAAFERAGYVFYKKLSYQGVPSLAYQYKTEKRNDSKG